MPTVRRTAVLPPLFLTALLALAASPLAAQEEILSYDVRVEVGAGGVLTVTEDIEVRALRDEIRHGIYRDFPTRFPREDGLGTVVAPFRVLSVYRDGSPEPYTVRGVRGPDGRRGVRIRIGDPDALVSTGVHRYTVVYETARWLRFGPGADELSWNVTGTGWDFPIRSATAALDFPGGSLERDPELEAWTGPEGATERNASWSWDPEANAARFRTTASLDAREGLTVRVALPNGVVDRPTSEQRARWFWLDWGGWVDAGLIAGLVLAVYLFMWVRVGRDPESGAVVVRYEPPEGFSPAGLGYLRERGYHPAQLTAALVSLGVRGGVHIEQDDGEWTIRATGDEPDDLAREERTLYRKLVGDGGSVTLDGSSEARVRKAMKRMRNQLQRQIERTYFLTNRRWFLAGAAVSLAGFGALAWRYRFAVPREAWFLGVWLTLWSVGVGAILVRLVRSWRRVFTGGELVGSGAISTTLFSVPFVAAEVGVGYLLYQRVPAHLVAAAVVIGLLNVLFFHLLERPTLRGRGVLDHLEGFRRFLGATEEDRMNRLQRPDRSLELFERFLPHAVALGVANEWAARFEDALEPGPEGDGSRLGWYSGASVGASASSVASDLGGSFSSSLSSSSASPAGSGGGAGGGVGGGGGGGGGGGW